MGLGRFERGRLLFFSDRWCVLFIFSYLLFGFVMPRLFQPLHCLLSSFFLLNSIQWVCPIIFLIVACVLLPISLQCSSGVLFHYSLCVWIAGVTCSSNFFDAAIIELNYKVLVSFDDRATPPEHMWGNLRKGAQNIFFVFVSSDKYYFVLYYLPLFCIVHFSWVAYLILFPQLLFTSRWFW